ncbi:MAG: ABC transporter permease [Deltaproteobacteria bacterium]|nr:ABC transporter permease [Deltaproteobacteria bacterium]MBW2306952.1 ABC transporter permease [Deltaproteobacteria bacterium]
MSVVKLFRDLCTDPGGTLRERPEVGLVPMVFVVIVTLWEFVVRYFQVPIYFIPAPSLILEALFRGFNTNIWALDGYWVHIMYTVGECIGGFVIGSLLGILVGTLISQFDLVEKTMMPYVVGFQTLPKVAIAPLFIIWFGLGITSKLVLSAMITFFPLLINSIVGFKSTEQDKIDLMRSLAANEWQIFYLVKFPNAMPFVFAGLEMGIVYSLIGAIVGEFIGGEMGLGVLIMQLNLVMDIAGVFATLIILSMLGIVFHLIIKALEKKVIFWSPKHTQVIGT